MKSNPSFLALPTKIVVAGLATTCLCLTAQAADVIKADNIDSLDLNTSWTSAAPTSTDIAVWDSTVTGANSSPLGADVSWDGIRVTSPGGAITVPNLVSAAAIASTASSASLTYAVAPTTPLVNGNRVVLGGAAPGGFTAGTSYYVVNATATSFELSTTPGGPSITATSATAPTVSGGFALNLGSGGIDMSAATQNLTVAPVTELTASQTFNVTTGRTLTFSSALGGTGLTLTKAGAGTLLVASPTVGTIQIDAGTLNLINASGSTSAFALNGGTLAFTNGFVGNTVNVMAGGGTVTVNGNRTVGGAFTGSGALTLAPSGTALMSIGGNNSGFSGTVTVGGTGSIRLTTANGTSASAGYIINSALTSNQATTHSLGSLSGSGTLQGAAATRYSIGALNTDTTYGGVASGTIGITKVGSGTLTLAGANTYTGSTNINAGTLALGASDRLADTSALVLNGGTFGLNGFSETMGTVDLDSNSTIDFGSGTANLAFSGSSAVDWSTFTLNITNWTLGSDTFRVGLDGTGLTASQLSHINFDGFVSGASIDSNGFVTPVPEPGVTASLGLAGLALLVYRRMRTVKKIA